MQQILTLVDGTLLKGLPVLLQAALGDPRTSKLEAKFRLHTQFDLERGVPIRIDVTEGISRGEADERAVLARALESGRCYVKDRGYAKFKLFNDIVAAQSSYVCRLRDNSCYQIEEQRPLAAEDTEAGITLDAVVRMGDYTDAEDCPDHPLRLVVVQTTPHEKRGGPQSNGLLLIATNLLDVPAEIIALIYRYRWTIEMFFRFFKHVLGCRHLLEHDRRGSRSKPMRDHRLHADQPVDGPQADLADLRDDLLLLHGLADEDELLAHLAKLQAHVA